MSRYSLILASALSVFAAQTQAQYSRPTVWLMGGQAATILGSKDPRTMIGAAIQTEKPDKRLSFKNNPALLVWEGNVLHSWGHRHGKPHVNSTHFGALAMGRYVFGKSERQKYYWEAGWGMQYVTKVSEDIEAHLNSTPTFGVGVIFPHEKHTSYLGIRFLHISNAGTNGGNRGQNQFMLTLGCKL